MVKYALTFAAADVRVRRAPRRIRTPSSPRMLHAGGVAPDSDVAERDRGERSDRVLRLATTWWRTSPRRRTGSSGAPGGSTGWPVAVRRGVPAARRRRRAGRRPRRRPGWQRPISGRRHGGRRGRPLLGRGRQRHDLGAAPGRDLLVGGAATTSLLGGAGRTPSTSHDGGGTDRIEDFLPGMDVDPDPIGLGLGLRRPRLQPRRRAPADRASPTARSRFGSVPTSISRHATCSSCRLTTWWHERITRRIFPNHPAGTLAKARPAHDIPVHGAPPRIPRRASHPRLAGAGRRAQGRPGTRARRTPRAATTGRPARSTRKRPPRSTSTTRKGYYYCFGCHAKGDAVTFLRETENLGFIEAVELLAPRGRAWRCPTATRPTPSAPPRPRASPRRWRPRSASTALQLSGARAAEARAYLDRRGLAPGHPRALRDRLRARRPHRAARAPDGQGLRPRPPRRGRADRPAPRRRQPLRPLPRPDHVPDPRRPRPRHRLRRPRARRRARSRST